LLVSVFTQLVPEYVRRFTHDQNEKLQQFTKLCKGDVSQNSKTAKMVLGRYYRVLNSRLALTRLAISGFKILDQGGAGNAD